jgi:hypothetical protein
MFISQISRQLAKYPTSLSSMWQETKPGMGLDSVKQRVMMAGTGGRRGKKYVQMAEGVTRVGDERGLNTKMHG